MPLLLAPLNTDLKIIRLLVNDKVKKYLESLGLTVDTSIRLLSKVNGNVILMVKDGRLAIDSNMANKILVA